MLCSKTLIVSGAVPTDQGTRSPIELFWTANKYTNINTCQPSQYFGFFCDYIKPHTSRNPSLERLGQGTVWVILHQVGIFGVASKTATTTTNNNKNYKSISANFFKKEPAPQSLVSEGTTIWKEFKCLHRDQLVVPRWVKSISDSCIQAQILTSIRPNAFHFISPFPILEHIGLKCTTSHILIHSGDYEFQQKLLRHSA